MPRAGAGLQRSRPRNSVAAASVALCINGPTPARATCSSASPSSLPGPHRSSGSASIRSFGDTRIEPGVGLLPVLQRGLEGTSARRLLTARTGRGLPIVTNGPGMRPAAVRAACRWQQNID